MKGIIIDGVAAAGKSITLQHLQTRIIREKEGSTKLFISEHYTQRVFEDKIDSGQLDAVTLAKHIDGVILGLGEYQEMLAQSKFALKPSRAEVYVTIERFLLTYFATLPALLEKYPLAKARHQFEQLASYGITHYLIALSGKKIRENVATTLTHRNARWAAHIESKGGLQKVTEENIVWQEKLLGFAKLFERCMRIEIIELKDQSYEEMANRIYEKEYQ